MPTTLLFVFWLVMASARLHVLYALFGPVLLLLPLVRGLATVVVTRVPERDFRRVPTWWLFAIWLAMVAYVSLCSRLFQAYAGQPFKIPSASMLPSLVPQDHVFVSRVFGHPKRGELIAYVDPDHVGYSFIERVIALGGEGIEFKDGRPWINGWEVPRCVVAAEVLLGAGSEAETGGGRGEIDLEYLGDQSYLVFLDHKPTELDGPWVVDRDEVFVVSDNRNNGVDSRSLYHGQGGGIPSSNLIGSPLFLWLAFKADGAVDWSRVNLPLDAPRLPSDLAALEPALRACLNRRPAHTEPPVAR